MTRYQVTYRDEAQAEAEAATFGLIARRGPEAAVQWYAGLLRAVDDALREMPGRFALSEDGCLVYPGTLVRQMRYGSGGNIFRILFHVIEPNEDEDKGVVVVLRIRHAAMRPLMDEAAAEGQAS